MSLSLPAGQGMLFLYCSVQVFHPQIMKVTTPVVDMASLARYILSLECQSIALLTTGAGVSVTSGIPDVLDFQTRTHYMFGPTPAVDGRGPAWMNRHEHLPLASTKRKAKDYSRPSLSASLSQ